MKNVKAAVVYAWPGRSVGREVKSVVTCEGFIVFPWHLIIMLCSNLPGISVRKQHCWPAEHPGCMKASLYPIEHLPK